MKVEEKVKDAVACCAVSVSYHVTKDEEDAVWEVMLAVGRGEVDDPFGRMPESLRLRMDAAASSAHAHGCLAAHSCFGRPYGDALFLWRSEDMEDALAFYGDMREKGIGARLVSHAVYVDPRDLKAAEA